MNNSRRLLAAGVIVVVYLGLGLTNALTKAPWCDEAWFGSPAYNLAFHGFLGTTVLDPASSTWKNVKLTGIDARTYWVMPLDLLLNAAAFRCFGFSIFPMRLLSLLWGVVTLLAWGLIVWKLTGRHGFALAVVGLIAIDYHFLAQAADGRMDSMAAALGWSGLAAYLLLRERSLALAVGVSQCLIALAIFTHPNGVMAAVMLAAAAFYLDRKRLNARLALLAAFPYIALAVGWGLYILQKPADFAAQFLGNLSGRGPTIATPLLALREEIVTRYLANYGMASWSSLSGRINVIPLLLFAGGAATCALIPAIRRDKAYGLLLIWTAIVIFFLAELEGLKTQLYLIYATPLFTALLMVAADWAWSNLPKIRILVAGTLAVFCLLQISRTLIVDARRPRQSTYDPAVQYLRTHFRQDDLIMGGAQFIFDLGPEWRILDDIRLGYNSGKWPDVVVIDPAWADRIDALKQASPAIHAFVVRRLQTAFHEVYNHEGYRILVRSISAG